MAAFALHARYLDSSVGPRRSRRVGVTRFGFGQLLPLLLVVAFLIGTLVCGPAEHAALETSPTAALPMATSNLETPALLKVADDHKAPVKKSLDACTGHCATHSVSLPAAFALETASFSKRATWLPQQDTLRLTNRPALLDRPPRA